MPLVISEEVKHWCNQVLQEAENSWYWKQCTISHINCVLCYTLSLEVEEILQTISEIKKQPVPQSNQEEACTHLPVCKFHTQISR